MGWVVAAVLVVVLALAFTADALRKRRARRRFLADRESLSDAAFCDLVCRDDPADGPLWVAIRRAVAGHCGVPAEALHPADRLDALWRMSATFDGFDPLDVVFRLERLLGIPIRRESLFPEDPMPGVRPLTFSDLGRFLVVRVREIVSAASPSGAEPGRTPRCT